MGYELWTSPVTGYRRRGTRLSEFRDLLDGAITARAIFEPLQSCPANADATSMRGILQHRDFDVAGVMEREYGPVTGWVAQRDLVSGSVADHRRQIPADQLISDAASLTEVLSAFVDHPFLFVRVGDGVQGIVARTDLNKPPVRVYLFGLISLLEMHLNFWVRRTYPSDQWQPCLGKGRLAAAREEKDRQSATGVHAEIVDCLQFCDRRDLVLADSALRDRLGLQGKQAAKRRLSAAEKLRNRLAHSQQNVSRGGAWDELIDLVRWIEELVATSDQLVERDAAASARVGDRLLWMPS